MRELLMPAPQPVQAPQRSDEASEARLAPGDERDVQVKLRRQVVRQRQIPAVGRVLLRKGGVGAVQLMLRGGLRVTELQGIGESADGLLSVGGDVRPDAAPVC